MAFKQTYIHIHRQGPGIPPPKLHHLKSVFQVTFAVRSASWRHGNWNRGYSNLRVCTINHHWAWHSGGWKEFGKRGEVCRGALLAFGADLSLFVLIGFWIVFSKLQTFSNRSIANVFCIPGIEVSHCLVHSNSESFNGLVCDKTMFFHVLPVWSDAI